jgi:hypothetical protein
MDLSLLQTTVSTQATLTEEREWIIAIQLVAEHGSGQKKKFPSLEPNYTK